MILGYPYRKSQRVHVVSTFLVVVCLLHTVLKLLFVRWDLQIKTQKTDFVYLNTTKSSDNHFFQNIYAISLIESEDTNLWQTWP